MDPSVNDGECGIVAVHLTTPSGVVGLMVILKRQEFKVAVCS